MMLLLGEAMPGGEGTRDHSWATPSGYKSPSVIFGSEASRLSSAFLCRSLWYARPPVCASHKSRIRLPSHLRAG